jgi:hypothetical protein
MKRNNSVYIIRLEESLTRTLVREQLNGLDCRNNLSNYLNNILEVFLPLGVLISLVIFLYVQDEKEKAAIVLSEKISQARSSATPEGKQWQVS